MKRTKLFAILSAFLFVLLLLIIWKENYVNRLFNNANDKHISFVEKGYLKTDYYQQEMELYKVYQQKSNIVMLGNSITYRCNWNELLNRQDIVNRGIPGDITKGFLARLESVHEVNPSYCFIMGGINDLNRGVSEDQVLNNIILIIDNLKLKNITPILQSIFYVANDFPRAAIMNKSVKNINSKLEDYSKENNITFLDLNEHLENPDYLKKEYSLDGIHLTGLAYEKWGELISAFLQKAAIN